jgi:hypothetical protein
MVLAVQVYSDDLGVPMKLRATSFTSGQLFVAPALLSPSVDHKHQLVKNLQTGLGDAIAD